MVPSAKSERTRVEAIEEFLESWCAWFGGFAFAAFYLGWGSAINIQKMPPLFTVVVTVAAISVGFLGTAKAILISISTHKLMRTLKETGQHRRLMDYLLSAMWSALFLVVLSAFYLLVDFRSNALSTTVLLTLWFGLTGYTLFSNARLIYNFSKILRYL